MSWLEYRIIIILRSRVLDTVFIVTSLHPARKERGYRVERALRRYSDTRLDEQERKPSREFLPVLLVHTVRGKFNNVLPLRLVCMYM